jgi:hypothetical protein
LSFLFCGLPSFLLFSFLFSIFSHWVFWSLFFLGFFFLGLCVFVLWTRYAPEGQVIGNGLLGNDRQHVIILFTIGLD